MSDKNTARILWFSAGVCVPLIISTVASGQWMVAGCESALFIAYIVGALLLEEDGALHPSS